MPVNTATISISSSFINLPVTDDFRLGNYEIVDAIDGVLTGATPTHFVASDTTHGLVYDVTGSAFTYHLFAPGIIDDVTSGLMTKAVLKTTGGVTVATITFNTPVDMAGLAGSPDEAALNAIFGQYAYTYNGFSSADNFTGLEQGDTINGGAGNDYLAGGAGNDLINGGAGADTLLGGPDLDTVSYAGSAQGVNVDLNKQDGIQTQSSGDAAGDVLTGFENILGSSLNDTLTGDGSDNTIEGGSGNDSLTGGNGVDTLSYMAATAGVSVSLAVATAQNTVGAGTDTVLQFENITGSAFGDTLTGTAGDNAILGGKGNDYIEGGDGNDSLEGGDEVGSASGSGDRLLYTHAAAAVTVDLSLTGAQDTKGAGIDTVKGFDWLFGSQYDDVLKAGPGWVALNGWGGDDWLVPGSGYNALEGGVPEQSGDFSDFNDTVDYSAIVDPLANLTITLGAAGAPTLVSSSIASDASGDNIARIENIVSGAGADTITGNEFANKLYGGDGNDLLQGRAGADLLDGGNGTDTASFALSTAAVKIDLGLGLGQGGEAEGDTFNSIEAVIGSSFSDQIKSGAGSADLRGGAGSDQIQGGDGDDTLEGGAGADLMDGGAGEDLMSFAGSTVAVTIDLAKGKGSGGDATGDLYAGIEGVIGSKLNDMLVASDAGSKLYGGLGNDTLKSGAGNDLLDGGNATGSDVASYALSKLGVVVDLSQAGPQNTVGAGSDTLVDIENLIGSAGDDILAGNDKANRIEGGARDDIVEGGVGNDTLIGGNGIDTLTYEHAKVGVAVSLALTTAQTTSTGTDNVGIDTISGFENLTGGAKADRLGGDANENVVQGGLGNDTIIGGAGADSLDGGADADTVSYAGSTVGVTVDLRNALQESDGDAGGDILAEFENVTGSAQADTLTGDASDNVVEGGLGNDLLLGGASALLGDTLSYASSTAAVSVNLALAAAQNTGGAGVDTVSGFENLWGGLGADKLRGDTGANEIKGNEGSDTLIGGGGDDTIDGGAGSDTASFIWVGGSGLAADLATGATYAGSTITFVSIENLLGSSGDDMLLGNLEANRIDGGARNDTIDGGAGNDTLIGGSGVDTLSYESASGDVSVSLSVTAAQTTGGGGIDTASGFENLTGGAFNDRLTGTSGENSIDGGAGNDTIVGGAGSDDLDGGSDSDTVSYSGSSLGVSVDLRDQDGLTMQVSDGDADGDVLTGFENVLGSASSDVLTGDDNDNVIEGGLGDDVLAGGNGAEVLGDTLSYASSTAGVSVSLAITTAQATGGAGIDTVSGFENLAGGGGSDTLSGDGAANVIRGNAGSDSLAGGAGADTLAGGTGNDTLTGGADADVFLFDAVPGSANVDKITDFTVASDVIRLDHTVFTALGVGALDPEAFAFASAPAEADDRIIYNAATGALVYDSNGSAAGGSAQFALLQTGLVTLSAADFLIV